MKQTELKILPMRHPPSNSCIETYLQCASNPRLANKVQMAEKLADTYSVLLNPGTISYP